MFPTSPEPGMKLRHSARTDVGRTRDHNEDNYGVGETAAVEELGHLFIVCDGMGGHAAGEVASSLGVERILSFYYETPGEKRTEVLEQAFERANAWIHEDGRGSMGTTGVAALIYQDVLFVANVGDSRAYLIRNGAIHQISRDHSLVSDQVAAGLITAEQARSMHYRNVITRALGYQPEVTVDLFRWPLQSGDIVALTSDGLHGLVEDAEIASTLITQTLAGAVDTLVQLANERGGTDNITLVAIAIDELDSLDTDDEADAASEPDAITQPIPLIAPSAPTPKTAEITQEQPALVPPAPEPTAPAPPPGPAQRRTWPGLLLALALLAALLAAIFLPPLIATAPPAVTPGVTATAAPVPTALPSPAATTPAPSPSPTAAP
jgi:serine/threonine protein phosphatase PrpC